MAFQPGKSGNPGGRAKERQFADALRMELAAAGEDNKALRAIARNLINLAQKDDEKALPAINAIADRLDGKPAQAVEMSGGLSLSHEDALNELDERPGTDDQA
jgi:enoyl-CoA hydratase/carnithine racemase